MYTTIDKMFYTKIDYNNDNEYSIVYKTPSGDLKMAHTKCCQ